MIRPIFKGRVSKGKLTLTNRAKFDECLRGLAGEVEITIQRVQRKRSLAANGYYWGVLIQLLSEYTGHERDEVHAELKRKFLNSRSTSKLSTGEFLRYIDDCRRFAATLDVVIPSPGEVEWDCEMSA